MPRFGKRSRERLKGVDSRLVNVLNEVVEKIVQDKTRQLLEEKKLKVCRQPKNMTGSFRCLFRLPSLHL